MENTLIYLIGYPGVGKLTVAKAVCAKTGARLMDNHLVNNVAFTLIGADGVTPIAAPIWDEIRHIREAALRIVARHAPRHLSYVLTNVLLDEPGDRRQFAQVRKTAADRRAMFVPVLLTCEEEENLSRIVAPERRKGLKEIDVAAARERRRSEPILAFEHPNRLDLDTTSLPPELAAAQIISHVESLNK